MQIKELFNLQDDSSKEDPNQMISIRISSKKFCISFIQLFKYSKFFQEEYLHNIPLSETINKIEQTIQNYELQERSISTFIKLISDEQVDIQNDEYFDLCKLSSIFKVQNLQKVLRQYAEKNSNDVDFIIKLIIESQSKENVFYNDVININNESSINLENSLKDKINECLLNDKFAALPISIVYRIIEQGQISSEINSDFLYDFVIKSIEERHLLFRFVDIEKLSDDRFDHLYTESEKSKQNGQSHLFEFFLSQLSYIKILKEKIKNIQIEKDEFVNKCSAIQLHEEKLNKEIEQYKEKVEDVERKNKEFESQIKKLIDENNEKIDKMKNKFEQKITEITHENGELKNKIKTIEEEKEKQQQEIEKFRENLSGKQIYFSSNNEFNGVINYLKSLSNNIDDFLNITSSSVYMSYYTKYAIEFENDQNFFASKNVENSWIRFEFKKHFVILKNYTIRSYRCGKNFCHPRSWVIEGSNDNSNWDQLDAQNDTDVLNGSKIIRTFTIQNQTNMKFKFIRMRQTGVNWDSNNHLGFNNIEFYGILI